MNKPVNDFNVKEDRIHFVDSDLLQQTRLFKVKSAFSVSIKAGSKHVSIMLNML